MEEGKQSGCMCELCHPNWFLGKDGEFMPEQPDAPQPVRVEERVEVPTLKRQLEPVFA